MLRRMVRDLRGKQERERYWRALLTIDDVNRGLYELQRGMKADLPLSPEEIAAAWLRLRAQLDREVQGLGAGAEAQAAA